MPVTGGGGTYDGGGASSETWEKASAEKISEAAQATKSIFGSSIPFEKLTAADLRLPTATAIPPLDYIAATPDPEPTTSASDMRTVVVTGKLGNKHRVILREVGDRTSFVAFEVLPEIQETHQSEYEPIAPTQFPGAFQKYKGSSSTQWTLNATLISRNSAEATKNYRALMRLRGWMQPYFGQKTGVAYRQKLGAPPPVLTLTGLRDLIGPVPVVITSLTWTWPRDVDYIATTIPSETDGNFIPFPAILNLPITLVESYSIDQFNNFSLEDYRAGNMKAAFNSFDDQTVASTDKGNSSE